jgi:acyl-homoserine lactone acylase PvdQ
MRQLPPGSNEWAVSGAHTASGKAMLSNDMHLEHSIPDIWHEEDLQAGSFHVAGVTTPGIPLIIEGHNEHISWGLHHAQRGCAGRVRGKDQWAGRVLGGQRMAPAGA